MNGQDFFSLYLDNHINDYQADLWPQNTERITCPGSQTYYFMQITSMNLLSGFTIWINPFRYIEETPHPYIFDILKENSLVSFS